MSAPEPSGRKPGNAGIGLNGAVGVVLAFTALAMLAATFAAVPLYSLFCRSTGFAGATLVAHTAPALMGRRQIIVRFDANVAQGLPWTVEPETDSVTLRTGATATVYFKFRNRTDRLTAANAVYNVSPNVAGAYFDKIACFCFSTQRLGPGESAELPVVFFLDPALEQDATMNGIDTLTLSYTLYPAKDGDGALASEAPAQGREPRL